VRSDTGSALPPAVAAVRTLRGNVPAELTSFVGRRRERSEIKRLLSAARLVTLTGLGGVGKTRLAVQAAGQVRRACPDGVWLVELADLCDPELVAHEVAAALRLREQPAPPALGVLIEYLRARRTLVVLDTCEHLLDGCAALVSGLLRACPDLRILATSREPFDIIGEVVVPVPPLSLPSPERLSVAPAMEQSEAVCLFVDRAKAAVPMFCLSGDNRAAVAAICHRLDGLPLAIELAAARLRVLSPDQILQRLTDRYRFLTGGAGRRRHRTLRACVEWSYELCTPAERTLWTRLAVFADGFELDAAETVCAGDAPAPDLLDTVASLVNKSILIRQERGRVVWYRLLETVRDYAIAKLRDSGEHPALRRRHRAWYEHLVQQANRDWIGPRQGDWLSRLDREYPNIRAALAYCVTETAEAQAGLRIVAALHSYWKARGQLSEGRYWLDQALACEGGPTAERGRALFIDSVLAGLQGDIPAATARAAQLHDLARQRGDPSTHALAAHAYGHLALVTGDLPGALATLEDAVAAFRAVGDVHRRVAALFGLAVTSGLLGDQARAAACHDEITAITDARGESSYRGYSLWALGLAAWRQGDHRRAAELVNQTLRLEHRLHDPIRAAMCFEVLAWIAAHEHHAERAATLLGAAAALAQATGTPTVAYPNLHDYHHECERRTRQALGDAAFEAAFQHGKDLSVADAIHHALGEQPQPAAPPPAPARTTLTRRQQQVAELIADGLTNKDIAAKLLIAQRTADSHVESILIRLGFTSRSQVAAWITTRRHHNR
jgi:predicted ATPase/DNA-binding CsgD family transcriptional regulator